MSGTSRTLMLTEPSQVLATARSPSAPPSQAWAFIHLPILIFLQLVLKFRPTQCGRDPRVSNSQETLIFFGFQPDVAKTIFESWQQLQQTPDELGYGDDIITSAEYYIEIMADVEDAWLPTHNWRQALAKMGLNRQLADAILDSDFDEIRKSQSASAWVRDSFRISWEFLQGLDRRVRRTPSPSLTPRPAMRAPTIPDHVDGRTILHKGGSFTRLAAAFDDDGTFKISRLLSNSPDFHRNRNGLFYLTKDLDIAEKYTRYAQRRVPLEEGCILSFAVPNELCADSRQIYGRDWQELVWWSRSSPYLEDKTLAFLLRPSTATSRPHCSSDAFAARQPMGFLDSRTPASFRT